MAVEYSYPLVQTVEANNGNVLFLNGDRCCKKGLIMHTDNSGVFRVKGVSNCCKTIYKVHFKANIAVSAGGTVGEISVALVQNGEVSRIAVATVTPTVAEAFFNASFETFVELPCGCCDTISVRNISDTPIDVINANIVIDRVA